MPTAIAPKRAGETIVLAAAAFSVCCAGPLDLLALALVPVAPVSVEVVRAVLAASPAVSKGLEEVVLELSVVGVVAVALPELIRVVVGATVIELEDALAVEGVKDVPLVDIVGRFRSTL